MKVNPAMIIEKVTSLNLDQIIELVEESYSEGHNFGKRFVDEYFNGYNRFDKPGESLYVARVEDMVIGICGLNIDPFLNRIDVGRVRRFYVLSKYRGNGIGKELLRTIVIEAKKSFKKLTLYTENPIADNLYTSMGFLRVDGIDNVSHILNIEE